MWRRWPALRVRPRGPSCYPRSGSAPRRRAPRARCRSTWTGCGRCWRLRSRTGTGDVVDDNSRVAVLDVRRDQRVEALLTGGVPELHAQTLVVDVDRLADEVHAHGRLHKTKGTCSWPVKLSKMKRLIIEVLPTDWSPTSTILHLIGLPSIMLLIFLN